MRKDINIILGKRVWEARKKEKITREQLAEKINVSARFLADVESGETGVSVSTLKALSEALFVSADYLIGKDQTSQETHTQLSRLAERIPEAYVKHAELILEELIKMTTK
ncbi:MAG: helix-turn-helix domain-containing protein [Clostridia bacterium]|nr:helix-turn-helix domain-containing protein [Clostridia bacterium]